MRNVQVDDEGNLRCWSCGSRNFTEKRTTRSKVAFGVGAVLAKKKLKCQQCGQYNDVGKADPYRPRGRNATAPTPAAPTAPPSLAPGPPGAPRWMPDPTAAHELRYWDGNAWTAHVSDAGEQATDPIS